MSANREVIVFHPGDSVRLAEGTYQGNEGVFVRLREDPKWADITESSGLVRCHPVAWLALGWQTPETKR